MLNRIKGSQGICARFRKPGCSYLSLDGVDLELDGGLAVLDGAVPVLHLDPHLRTVREVHVVLVVLGIGKAAFEI